jgi:hypothetical protein
VAPPVPLPWWRRWWDGAGRGQPWNAAFATVLLAGVVTLLWRHEEVPSPALDSTPPPAVSANSAKAQPEAVPPPTAGPASAVTVRPEARVAPDRVRDQGRVRVVPPARTDAPASDVAQQPVAEQAATGSGSLAQAAPAAAAAPQSARSADARARSEGVAANAIGRAASLDEWDALRMERNGAPVEWTRAEATGWDALLQSIASAASDGAAAATPDVRVQVVRQGRVVGAVQAAGDVVGWQPAGAAAASLRHDAALAAALRQAVAGLPQRP